MAKIEGLTANPAADAGRFVNAEERHGLAGRALRIVGIKDDPGNRFGPRWLVSVVDLATGEKLAIGLAHNAARDASYPAIAAMLADDGADEIEPVVLHREQPAKGGNPFWSFRTATDDEIAAAEAAGETDGDTEVDDEPDADADAEPAPVLRKGHRDRA